MNNVKCQCKCKKHHIYEKYYILNPATSSCKNGKYVASITDGSIIFSDYVWWNYRKNKNRFNKF